MNEKTVTSASVWYHISSATGDSASRWTKGAARKGIINGKRAVGAILFDREDIAEAIGEDDLLGAMLVIRRDTAYGTDAISVSMAPGLVGELDEQYMSNSQCVSMFRRELHKNHVIAGDEAEFLIPGATLRELKAGNVDALLLYQEQDGSTKYCRLADTATLKLYTGDGWKDPVWTRTVTEGDVISNKIYSHTDDLREIEYYINLKRTQLEMQPMTDIGTIKLPDENEPALGTFAGWKSIIEALRTGIEPTMADEPEWPEIADGAMPSADIVENLKSVYGTTGQGVELDQFYSFQILYNQIATVDQTKSNTWYTEQMYAYAGKEIHQYDEGHKTVTNWIYNFCGWIFQADSLQSVASAAIELTVCKSNVARPYITLYGIKRSTAPGTNSYSQVFGDEIVGGGYCNVGEPAKIQLNTNGINMLRNGTIYGVGIRYDNEFVKISKAEEYITYIVE